MRAIILVVVVGLTVAIVKPWAIGGSSDGPPRSLVAALPSIASSVPTTPAIAPPGRPVLAAGVPAPTWAEVEPVIEAHDVWGIRAILLARRQNLGSGPDPKFKELWSKTSPDSSIVDIARIARHDEAVMGLGITFPPEIEPLDMRIWRLHANEHLEWIDARPLAPADRDGSFTFVRSDSTDAAEAWLAGHYRVDLLAADQVHSVAVQIPDRSGIVPAPDEWPPATEADLIGPGLSDPSGVRAGPFATVDGRGVPVGARPAELMSSEEAWRSVIAGSGGLGPPSVATAYLPRATGLGVMLTNHAAVRQAIVRRIAPDSRFSASPMTGGISEMQGRTPWIAFAQRGGGVWPSGVYAITVAWTDPAGQHAETWHVELRPGPVDLALVR